MPRDGLDLLLRIEADRMARLSLDAGVVEAEAGSVIAEMKGYENDPTTVLFDDVVATAIKLHPYRNNTIGYEADVRTLTHADVVDHYRRNYRASNAVLAIAGDVERSDALAAVRRHFAQLPKLDPPRRTPAVEPPQTGERRTRLTGPVTRSYFKAAYPAPAASGADFAAFLVLQELVGGGSGVNFRQNDWGTPARAGSALYGATGDISTWFIPTAEPYVFMISGSVDAGASEGGVEQTIEARLRQLRDRLPTREALATARRAVARQLVFDVETTEDAAHQLAFFEGIGALEQLMTLNGQVALVSAADVNRAARRYLDPVLRTLGWFTPGKAPDDRTGSRPEPRRIGAGPGAASPQERASPPTVRRLSGGLPVVFQRSPLSDSATLGLVFVGQLAGASPDQPVAGYSLLTRRVLAREFDGGAADLLAASAAA
jgi:zinc protease